MLIPLYCHYRIRHINDSNYVIKQLEICLVCTSFTCCRCRSLANAPCDGIPCAAVLRAAGVPRANNCCAIVPRVALPHTFFCSLRCRLPRCRLLLRHPPRRRPLRRRPQCCRLSRRNPPRRRPPAAPPPAALPPAALRHPTRLRQHRRDSGNVTPSDAMRPSATSPSRCRAATPPTATPFGLLPPARCHRP